MQSPSADQLPAVQRIALARQLRHTLAHNPRNVDAHLSMAAIYCAERNFGEAIVHLQKAASLRKKDPDILNRLTNATLDAKKLNLARKYGRQLCEIEPRKANNHRLLGLVHMDMGHPANALRCFEKADRLAPDNIDTLTFIGQCHTLKGDHDQARAWYEKVIDLDPANSVALYNMAHTRKFRPGEVDDFIAKAQISSERTRDPEARSALHFAMGKAYDEAGRTDEAFESFQKGNELRKPQTPEPFMPAFVNNEETFTPAFFAARGNFGHESNRPVFILGMPRSGTTLVESLCGAHSQIVAGDEQTVMTALNKGLGRDSDLPGAYKKNVERMTKRDVRGLGEEYLQYFRPIAGNAPHFTDKLPHNFMNIGLIALLFPNARIIHCRRHPLANCFSLFSNSMRKFHSNYKTDLTRLGIYYRQYTRLMDHWRSVLPGRVHEIFYEDLVTNNEIVAREVIGHLGLAWEDGVMDRSGSQRSVRTLSGWQVRQPIYQTSKERWRRYEKHLAPLVDAIGPCVESYEEELASIALERGGAAP